MGQEHDLDLEEPYGPDGRYIPRECIVCHEDTQTRCGGCRQPICQHHESCPNGCDNFTGPTSDWKAIGER